MNNDIRVTAPRVRLGSGQQLTALSANFKIAVSQFLDGRLTRGAYDAL
jgi:hypothetical protein